MISIIGGGPSGSYLAYLLAKEGKKVNVFEEHEEIGKPVQCTGLVTSSIKKLIDLKDEFILNEISKIKVVAPDGESVSFNLKNPNYVFDRRRFDNYLYLLAKEEGVKFNFGKRFKEFKDGKVKFSDGSEFETDFLVGADGPLSSVAKDSGLYNHRKFMTGVQARVKGEFIKDTFVVYMGDGYFGWSVPESEEFSRVGVIASKGDSKKFFDSVLNRVKGRVIEWQSGLIPVYQPKIRCFKDNVFLIGDAATHCKASTHGGIIQGMIAGTALSEALVKGLDYDLLWRERLSRDLYVHLKIRKKLDKMGDKKLNYLVKLVKKEKVKKILETYDRDYASKIAFKLFFKEPRFFKLVF